MNTRAIIVIVSMFGGLVGCTASSTGTSGSDGPTGSVDASLVGEWYAGRGGTSIAYDEASGTFGAPSGSGMMFVFAADGTYRKATQSIESGACTMGFVAVESGVATTANGKLELHPTKGTMHTLSCSGSADTDQPLDVTDEEMTFSLHAYSQDASTDAITITDANGASAEFRRTK